jgi:hypothetical protein
MYHLKLVKGLSYNGVVSASQKNPDVYILEEALANQAVATGYFKLVSGEIERVQLSSAQDVKSGNLDTAQFENLKLEDLKRLAEDMGLDPSAYKKKADLIEAISSVEVTPASEENEVDYEEDTGSPTMIDLQKE